MPKMVGETAGGDPIVEVRSVRLVLQGDASHFNRLLSCSRCGREAPGRLVIGPSDLSGRVDAVVCKDCVRGATSTASSGGPTIAAESRATKAVPPRVGTRPQEPATTPDARLAALERQVTQLTELLQAERSAKGPSLKELSLRMEAGMAALTTVTSQLALKQEELGRAGGELELRVQEAIDSRTAVIEAQQSDLRAALESRVQELSVALESQSQQLSAAIERADAARVGPDVTAPAPANVEVARLEEQLDQRLASTTEAVAGRADRIEAQQAELRAALDSNVAQLRSVVAGVARARSEAVASEHAIVELVEGAESRAERIEAQHAEFRAALESSVDRLRTVEETLSALSRHTTIAMELHGQQLQAVDEGARSRATDLEKQQRELRTALETSVEQLRSAIDAEAARARAEWATRDRVDRSGARSGDLLDERLAGLAAAAEAGSHRLQAVEVALEGWSARVEAGQAELRASLESRVEQLGVSVQRQTDRLRPEHEEGQREWELESVDSEIEKESGHSPEASESLPRDLQTAFSEAVAAVQSSSAARADEQTARLETLEKAVAERTSEVSDLFDLQAALDTGMSRLASDLAAARGLSDGSSLGPLRSDVKALKEQIAAQNKAIAALKRSIETLGRKVPGRSPVAPSKVREERTDDDRAPKGTSRR